MTDQRLLAVSPNLPCAMDRQEWSLEDYHIGKTLYSGYAAQVYTATCRYSGMEVVLKVYQDVDKAPDVAQHEMYREVAIQSGLQHPNVVHLYGAFEEGDTLVLVQEYVPNGDLLALMQNHGGRVDEATTVKTVLRPLLGALMYLHRWGIVHRDVKPENVLFAADGSIKLADFGLAINMVEERPISRVGTLDYMAPEVLRCPIKQCMAMTPRPGAPARYGFATDVWAVGIVAYELLTGLPPYASECRYQAETRICSSLPPLFPHSISPMARDFILRTLAPIPGDRPTIRQLMEHPWIVNPDACLAAGRPHPHTYSYSQALSQPNLQPQRLSAGFAQSQPAMSHSTTDALLQHTLASGYGSDPQHSAVSRTAATATATAVSASPRPAAAVSAPPSAASTAAASPAASPIRQQDPPSQLSAAAVVPVAQGGPLYHPPHNRGDHSQREQQHPSSQQPHASPDAPTPIAVPNMSIDQQLRVLQQQQLLDLSRLPLDQIQGMIQKLQEAMQLAVVQQQQMQQQPPSQHLQPQQRQQQQPAGSEASAINSARCPGRALMAHSRCNVGEVPPAVSSNTPRSIVAGEDEHMVDVSPECAEALATGAYVVVGRMHAAANTTAAAATMAAATSAASYNCTNTNRPEQEKHTQHQPQQQQQRTASNLSEAAAAAAALTGPSASIGAHDSLTHASMATGYALRLCASRRTTADATPGTLAGPAVAATSNNNSPTQVSCLQPHSLTTRGGPVGAPSPASPRTAEGGSLMQAAVAAVPSNNAAAAPGVTLRPSCSGCGCVGGTGNGRCSHGGALHEGDGLVYVSIGSSRKATRVDGGRGVLGLDAEDAGAMVPAWMQQFEGQ